MNKLDGFKKHAKIRKQQFIEAKKAFELQEKQDEREKLWALLLQSAIILTGAIILGLLTT